jgi:hypothetical protein
MTMTVREARWPVAVLTAAGAWYASDSLRHRREHGDDGYELHGDACLDVGEVEFMYAAETLTGAPVSSGDDVELLINGDEIFPAFLETIEQAEHTINSSPTCAGAATSSARSSRPWPARPRRASRSTSCSTPSAR